MSTRPRRPSRLVTGLEIANIGETDEPVERVRRSAGERFEQEADVVAHVVTMQYRADEPPGRIVEDRQSLRA